jgi:hypothetical protein
MNHHLYGAYYRYGAITTILCIIGVIGFFIGGLEGACIGAGFFTLSLLLAQP